MPWNARLLAAALLLCASRAQFGPALVNIKSGLTAAETSERAARIAAGKKACLEKGVGPTGGFCLKKQGVKSSFKNEGVHEGNVSSRAGTTRTCCSCTRMHLWACLRLLGLW